MTPRTLHRNPKALETPIEHLSKLKQTFKDSDLPIIVDLMDWARLPKSHRLEIEKRYVVL